MELLLKYLTQNVLHMQKIGYICQLASTEFCSDGAWELFR